MEAVERRVITVGDFARRMRGALAAVDTSDWIEGEVGSLKRAASGHVYFTLKDDREDAALECVMYRMDALRVRQDLYDGAKVHAQAKPALWIPRGRLQLTVTQVQRAGLGSLLEQLERLKQKLASEGLFELARKRRLPAAPRIIGVVTSAHGAALHDIRTVAFRRGRVVLVLAPALVQGEGAAESLVRALSLIERDQRVEVVIVGRGGGSAEDLMAFNDERVVRKVASLRVPVVSAVGHEIDVTLTDLAADVRAATPSQAAELVVADASVQWKQQGELTARLRRAMRQRLGEDQGVLRTLTARLGDPRFVIAQRQQDLDELRLQAERLLRRRVQGARSRRDGFASRLLAQHPRVRVARALAALTPLGSRLRAALSLQLSRRRSRLETELGRLGALSPLSVLARGYAIASTLDGAVLQSTQQTAVGQPVRVRLHRGELLTQVLRLDHESASRENDDD